MKSGTSLLRTLLSQHENLYAGFETHWFNLTEEKSEDPALLMKLFDLVPEEHQAIIDETRATGPFTAERFIDVFMDHCMRRAGKTRWIEKTPANIAHFSRVQAYWKAPRLIHVTREYRDTFASWKSKKGKSLEQFLTAVSSAYNDVEPLLGKTTASYLEVDYLDLIYRAEPTMRRVLEWLGEPWSPACAAIDTEATRSQREKIKDVLGKDSATAISLTRPIFDDSVGQWERLITSDEAEQIVSTLSQRYAIWGDAWTLPVKPPVTTPPGE